MSAVRAAPLTSASARIDEKALDAIFREVDRCDGPGAAVGIALGGSPVYRKGFGLACRELPIALGPAVRMRLGTLTRHFTCLTYLLLCEEGRADIDAPLGRYLPQLHPVTRAVTVRQLMANTSGLRDPFDICFELSGLGRGVSSSALLELYRDIDDCNAPPDTTCSFNHGDWLLVGAVIEHICGRPLEEVMRERIFDRVGMRDTGMRRWDRDFVPNTATAHMMGPTGSFERTDCMDFAAAGSMISTVDDMLRWLAQMDAPRVGNPMTWRIMRAAHTLPNGTTTGCGLGLMAGRYRGIDILSYSGAWLGSSARMVKVPASGLDVIVMVNHHGVPAVVWANKILDACLPELEPPVVPTSVGPHSTGVYRSITTGRVIQLSVHNQRQVVCVDGQDLPFQRDADGVLRMGGAPQQSIELVGMRARPEAIRFQDFGNLDELAALPACASQDRSAAAIDSFTGRYRSASTGTEASVVAMADGVKLLTRGRFGSLQYDLECVAADIWRARLPGSVIPFGGVLSVTAEGFYFSNSMTRMLPFRR